MNRDPVSGQFRSEYPWLVIIDATNEVLGEFWSEREALRFYYECPQWKAAVQKHLAAGLSKWDAEIQAHKEVVVFQERP